jgi:hypothetical protein
MLNVAEPLAGGLLAFALVLLLDASCVTIAASRSERQPSIAVRGFGEELVGHRVASNDGTAESRRRTLVVLIPEIASARLNCSCPEAAIVGSLTAT